jgi:hypothetical protein
MRGVQSKIGISAVSNHITRLLVGLIPFILGDLSFYDFRNKFQIVLRCFKVPWSDIVALSLAALRSA